MKCNTFHYHKGELKVGQTTGNCLKISIEHGVNAQNVDVFFFLLCVGTSLKSHRYHYFLPFLSNSFPAYWTSVIPSKNRGTSLKCDVTLLCHLETSHTEGDRYQTYEPKIDRTRFCITWNSQVPVGLKSVWRSNHRKDFEAEKNQPIRWFQQPVHPPVEMWEHCFIQ